MNIKLEIDRLYLREFTLEDAETLYNMHLDPAIIKYTGDLLPWSSTDHARDILRDMLLPQYRKGIGRWAVHLKTDYTFIGWCGLKDTGEETDLGYRYIQQYWGHGYATEAAQAVLQYGIKHRVRNIVGVASVENTASVKILEKIGLSFLTFYTETEPKVEECVKYICKESFE